LNKQCRKGGRHHELKQFSGLPGSVVEPLSYVELKKGLLEFKLGRLPPIKAAIIIGMGSRGACQYVGMGAALESPTVAKRILRDLILSLENRKR
jgi:hypothetical protein